MVVLQLILIQKQLIKQVAEAHFDNLAELLPEDVLGKLGSELAENYNNINHLEKIGKIVIQKD